MKGAVIDGALFAFMRVVVLDAHRWRQRESYSIGLGP
jgi:hypothetical protein